MKLTVASWNIHRGVGGDGRFRADRIARVIGELDADVVALQEVGAHRSGVDIAANLRDIAPYAMVMQTTLHDRHGAFGNALLTRLPIMRERAHDLSVAGREPRGALDVVVAAQDGTLRIINVHLGLTRGERRLQVQRLLAIVGGDATLPTLLLGDFNVWRRRDDTLAPLRDRITGEHAPRTFPAVLPLLSLDRVFHDVGCMRVTAHAHRSRAARIASDHLPLIAHVET